MIVLFWPACTPKSDTSSDRHDKMGTRFNLPSSTAKSPHLVRGLIRIERLIVVEGKVGRVDCDMSLGLGQSGVSGSRGAGFTLVKSPWYDFERSDWILP